MIAAFDLGTRYGWCVGTGAVAPTLGCERLKSADVHIGPFLLEFDDWLSSFLDEWAPEVVIFEAPVLPRMTKLATTRKLQGLSGVLEMACARRQLDCREVSVQDIKIALTGKGNAKKPDQTVPAARSYGIPITYADEADALGAWLCAIRALRPEHAARWPALPGPLFERAA